MERFLDRFLDRLGLERIPEREGRPSAEAKLLFPTRESIRRDLITRAGDAFLKELDGPNQRRVVEVFIQQDEEGLRRMIGTWDTPTVEGMALALDAHTRALGGESCYAEWFGEVIGVE